MPFEQVKQLGVGQVPLPHLTQPSGFAARGEQELAVGRERNRIHVAAMALEGLDDGVRFRGAQFNLAVAPRRDPFPARTVSEGVDRVARGNLRLNFRNGQLLGLELGGRPGAGVNPGADQRDLLGLQCIAFFWRRHDQFFAVLFDPALDHPHEQALLALARNNHRAASTPFHE